MAIKLINKNEDIKPSFKTQFNFNDYILVKLDDEGFKIWLDYYNKNSAITEDTMTMEELKRIFSHYFKENGFIEFQLHTFIRIFGFKFEYLSERNFGFELNFYFLKDA